MKMVVFSVRDAAVGAFLPPLFARSKGEALRMFAAAVQEPSHQFSKSKKDYALFHLGDWDDASGFLSSLAQPVQLISALELDAPEGAAKLDNFMQ